MFGLRGIWSILQPVALNVAAPPDVCQSMLNAAARPSTDRLHLREAFSEGRRYHILPTPTGFRMATTSKTLFNRRRRTDALGVLVATVTADGDGRSAIALQARLRPLAVLNVMWVPVTMTFLIWPVPWPRALVVLLLGLTFACGWASVRFGGALEANEMVFFIQKTFEDIPKFTLGRLPAAADHIIGAREFDALWEQFVGDHPNVS